MDFFAFYQKIFLTFRSFNCGICFEEKLNDNRFTIKGCNHFYCSDCIRKYITWKLKQKIVRIRCPVSGCSGQLDPEHCRSIIAHQVFDKWSKALITLACNKYALDEGEIMLHKLAKTMKWKQCPGCNIYIEKKVAQRRQWSGEEAELDHDYNVKFLLDEILDEPSEFCNSMHCRYSDSNGTQLIRTQYTDHELERWCGCNFCYNCGVSYDDPKGHDSRRQRCGHVYVPSLIGSAEKAATMKNTEGMPPTKSADETSTMKGACETSTMKSVPSPWWKGVQVTYFSDCRDISELVPNGIPHGSL